MKISLIGLGPGNKGLLSLEAGKLIEEADVIIGADRMIAPYAERKQAYNLYRAEEILDRLKRTGIASSVAVLLSGDPGFYSTAKKLLKLLDSEETFKDTEIKVIPGISSMQYFLENLHISWENVKFLSLHGKRANIISYIRRYPKVFTLLGKEGEIREICERLHYYGMDSVKIIIGERLSYDDENIILSDPVSFIRDNRDADRLSVALFLNDEATDTSLHSIADSEFIRGEVPMSKEEVRTISISKLKLSPDSILYDIGSGTGSVAIEAAIKLIDGEVYAIEKKSDAVDLIQRNKRKFCTDNLKVINDTAPSGLDSIPAPTHAFIGGSGGRLKEIIEALIKKNPKVRIVINMISLDTLSEFMSVMNEKNWRSDMISVGISKSKDIAGNRLMIANNQVFIAVIGPEDRVGND